LLVNACLQNHVLHRQYSIILNQQLMLRRRLITIHAKRCGQSQKASYRRLVHHLANEKEKQKEMIIFLIISLINSLPVERPCSTVQQQLLPYCDKSFSFTDRTADLVSRLTLAEKVGLMGNAASAVARLDIPAYQWWSEALHGVAYSPGVTFGGRIPTVTGFPQPIVSAATFDVSLFAAIGAAIGKEARAMSNFGRAGLTFWSPNLNIFRDPRWGRGQETPGEDPFLTSTYVNHYVNNLQGGNITADDYLLVSATCKHYAAYSLEKWGAVDRFDFDAIVNSQDLADTYLPAFHTCMSSRLGAASGAMCSYNAVNGVPSCASDVLRKHAESWHFDGYTTGDCGAIDCIQYSHNYTKTTDGVRRCALLLGLMFLT
jgi:beta-glucosidase-like glycosyl hydrolase